MLRAADVFDAPMRHDRAGFRERLTAGKGQIGGRPVRGAYWHAVHAPRLARTEQTERLEIACHWHGLSVSRTLGIAGVTGGSSARRANSARCRRQGLAQAAQAFVDDLAGVDGTDAEVGGDRGGRLVVDVAQHDGAPLAVGQAGDRGGEALGVCVRSIGVFGSGHVEIVQWDVAKRRRAALAATLVQKAAIREAGEGMRASRAIQRQQHRGARLGHHVVDLVRTGAADGGSGPRAHGALQRQPGQRVVAVTCQARVHLGPVQTGAFPSSHPGQATQARQPHV